MTIRVAVVALVLLMFSGLCHGKEPRWSNFAEDSDLKYYLDLKSVHALPDNVFVFWVKSVAKDKEYFKNEYKLSDLSYIFTNYEIDCATASYRVRGTIMFDKNRRELKKILPPEMEEAFEPVPPESMIELAQDEVCVNTEAGKPGAEELPAAGPASISAPSAPTAPSAPAEPEPAASPEPPSMQ